MEKFNLSKKGIIVTIITTVLILVAGTICFAMIKINNKTIETVIEDDEEQAENIIEEANVIEEEIVEEPEEEEKEKQKENKKPGISSDTYYVKINLMANVVNIYTKDANGNYTVPVKALLCSTGKATPTSGKYRLNGTKHRWHTLFGGVYGQYTTAIVGDILFHSVPYSRNGDPSSLIYGYYDKLGSKASAGCIRLTVQDAIWVYNNITRGTVVEFYSDPNPGPLGKPTAQKISSNTTCRGWDPTDPTPGNPWRNYVNNTPSQSTPAQGGQTTEKPIENPKPAEPEKPKDNTITTENTIVDNTTTEGADNNIPSGIAE